MTLPQRPGQSRPSQHRRGRGLALRAGSRNARPAHALPFTSTPLSPKPHIGHFFSSPAPHRGNPSLSPWTHRGNRPYLRRPTSGDPLPGQYFDQETGLHYNYFRDYDPTTGRYIESDPIGLGGGLNTYEYAKQNPLRISDPWGLLAFGELSHFYSNNPNVGSYSGFVDPNPKLPPYEFSGGHISPEELKEQERRQKEEEKQACDEYDNCVTLCLKRILFDVAKSTAATESVEYLARKAGFSIMSKRVIPIYSQISAVYALEDIFQCYVIQCKKRRF